MLKTDSYEFKRGVFYFLKPMNYKDFKEAEHNCHTHGELTYKNFKGVKRWDFSKLVNV